MALASGDIALILPIRIIPSQFSTSLLTMTTSGRRLWTAESDLAIAEQDAARYPSASRSGNREVAVFGSGSITRTSGFGLSDMVFLLSPARGHSGAYLRRADSFVT